MRRAWVALGSNLGDPALEVSSALGDLGSLADTAVRARSRLYRSTAWGPVPQPDYVNAVAELETALEPEALLAALLDIERRHGRRRAVRWGPRTLDLDLLLYDGEAISTPKLTIPHPGLVERPFVLLPLAEIASDVDVPGAGRVSSLLAGIDTSGVSLLEGA